ncbi:MAG: ABC transporter permease [Longicatena sp.]
MKNLFKYRFNCIMRNKTLLFWTLAFPLILATLFSVALPNLNKINKFEHIAISVVENEAYTANKGLQQVLKEVGDTYFDISYVSLDEGVKQLDENSETILIEDGKKLSIQVAKTGINQTIVESFFNEYLQKTSMLETMMKEGASLQQIQTIFQDTTSYIKEKETNNSDLISVYFYTILAMTALYAGYSALESVYVLQANLSDKAMRIGVAPTHKMKALFVDFVLSCSIHFVFLIIVLNYMQFVLHVSFGENIGYIYLLLGIGTFAGNAFGTFVGCLTKFDYKFKNGLLTSLTLLLSFCSGMMVVQMKYIIQTYVPLLASINPVNMVTDGLYALYYYGVGERYLLNIGSLLLFTLIFYVASYFMLRKRQYESLGL